MTDKDRKKRIRFYEKGKSKQKQRDYKAAIALFQQVLENPPTDFYLHAIHALGECYMNLFLSQISEMRDVKDQYIGHFAQIDKTKTVLPGNITATGKISEENLGYFVKAVDCFQKFIERSTSASKKAKVWGHLALLYWSAHHWKDFPLAPDDIFSPLPGNQTHHWSEHSIACLRKATELKPSDPLLWLNLGGLFRQFKQLTEGQKCLERAVKLAATEGNSRMLGFVLTNLAFIYMEDGDEAKGIETIKEAYSTGPNAPQDAFDWYNLALKIEQQKDFALAELMYKICLKLDPRFSPAWLSLGIISMVQNKFKQSFEYYKRALKGTILPLKPGHQAQINRSLTYQTEYQQRKRRMKLDILANFGTAHHAAGNYEMAKKYFKKAEKEDKEDFERKLGSILLGNAYFALKDMKNAIKRFNEAINHKIFAKKAWKRLGDVYQAMGDTDKAQECYQQAKQSDSYDHWVTPY